MRQQRIENYFSLSKSSHRWPLPRSNLKNRISFLDLPVSVRKRVYSAVGLISSPQQQWRRVTMNSASITERACQFEPESSPLPSDCPKCFGRLDESLWKNSCNCDPFPLALFTICRAISDEVTYLFYSQTRFEIAYTSPGKLSALEQLGPKAISCLRDLTIRLNVSFCPNGPACKDVSHAGYCHPSCRNVGHDVPLGWFPKSRDDKILLLSFRRLCGRLREHLQPGRLKLTFYCESRDHSLAADILASLMMLPVLRTCSIWLSRDFDPNLRQMAEETRLRLLGLPESRVTGHFPLRNLPKELELRMLRFTDLVAPHHMWYCKGGFRYSLSRERQHCKYRDPSDVTVACLERLPGVCCCKSEAHSFSTSACAHWHFPDALFLVDQQMASDALMIVNRENTWILRWKTLASASLPVAPPVLGRFLVNVRRLTIDLPCTSAYDHWRVVVDNLVNRCVVERLTLVIQMPHPEHPHVNLSGDAASPMWAAHCETIQRLATALAGRKFKDFFVVVTRPHVDFDEFGPTVIDCPSMGGYLDAMERWFEQQVVERNVDVYTRTKHLEASVCSAFYEWSPDCSQCRILHNISN